MKHTLTLLTALLLGPLSVLHATDLFLVENGQSRAEIVVAENRPRMTTLAALELRLFIEKMSGARLPIVTAPTARTQGKIHVGESAATQRLGVTSEGLRDGAYRIVTGADWGVLLGTRFVASQESLAHDIYKRRIVEAHAGDTALTVCFDGGWPYAAHRVLRNSTLEAWEAAGSPPHGTRPGEGETIASDPSGRAFIRYDDAPPLRNLQGNPEALCLYAGTSCEEIGEIPPVAELIQREWRDYQSTD